MGCSPSTFGGWFEMMATLFWVAKPAVINFDGAPATRH
jgi:hypothetical protein